MTNNLLATFATDILGHSSTKQCDAFRLPHLPQIYTSCVVGVSMATGTTLYKSKSIRVLISEFA